MNHQIQNQNTPSTSFDLLFLIRFIFYLWIIAKLIQVIIFRRKKLNVKQRIQRKYVFSHGEMIKNYSSEEVQLMVLTLSNTLKNATLANSIQKKCRQKINLNQKKKVNFRTTQNLYYDPPNIQDQNIMKWDAIQTKLSQISQKRQKEKQTNNNEVMCQQIIANENCTYTHQKNIQEEQRLIDQKKENNQLI